MQKLHLDLDLYQSVHMVIDRHAEWLMTATIFAEYLNVIWGRLDL